MTRSLLLTGLTLRLAAWLQKLGQKLQANKQPSKLLIEKRWFVCILPVIEGLKAETVMAIGPVDDAVVNNVAAFIAECCQSRDLECFQYQTSNHQKGLLWLIAQGKIENYPPSASINNDVAGQSPLDLIAGPLWLTGDRVKGGTVDLLTEEDATEIVRIIEDDDAIQVMNGLYLSTKNIGNARYETGSI